MRTLTPPANPHVAREIVIDGKVTFPVITTFEQFVEWWSSDARPERGRFSYLAGTVWIELGDEHEQGFSHNDARAEIDSVLRSIALGSGAGRTFAGGMRFTVRSAGLSTVPDEMFVLYATLQEGRVTLVPNRRRDSIEGLVGPPDMVLEVVSDASVEKDTVTLPGLYHAAGVPEFWRVDARKEPRFEIFRWADAGYVSMRQPDGWWWSEVFGRDFLLTAGVDRLGLPQFTLEHRA